jgi:hypothetical protein
MEPTKIICPHCNSNQCFEDTQKDPSGIEVSSYMCVSCGYTSTTLNHESSEMIKQYEESTAELVRDLRWIDSKGFVWYPIILNFPSFGIIFPDGTDKDNWSWKAAPAVEVKPEDQKKYPIPGQKDQYYTKRIDMAAGKEFKSNEFYDACKFIGFIQE